MSLDNASRLVPGAGQDEVLEGLLHTHGLRSGLVAGPSRQCLEQRCLQVGSVRQRSLGCLGAARAGKELGQGLPLLGRQTLERGR